MSCYHKDENGVRQSTWIIYDARGIPCGRVCHLCEEKVRAKYRPEIFSNPNYEADEQIEPDEWF